MGSSGTNAAITLSLLDRLTDLDPGSQKETKLSPWEEMRLFEESIARDLNALLNTRRTEIDFDPTYEQSTNSVLTFGIVDFTPYDLMGATERERVRSSIEQSIRKFEPRLTKVRVAMAQPDRLNPILHFQVTAQLRFHPQAKVLMFGVDLHRDSRHIAVKGEKS
jgi:type VI secretion system protein ImpF